MLHVSDWVTKNAMLVLKLADGTSTSMSYNLQGEKLQFNDRNEWLTSDSNEGGDDDVCIAERGIQSLDQDDWTNAPLCTIKMKGTTRGCSQEAVKRDAFLQQILL